MWMKKKKKKKKKFKTEALQACAPTCCYMLYNDLYRKWQP